MLYRVCREGLPAFQLRKGELGISIFDSDAVSPPLSETEILQDFSEGSGVKIVSEEDIKDYDLVIVPVLGAHSLSPRLREAHAEIRPSPGLTRKQFKQRLKELEFDERQ